MKKSFVAKSLMIVLLVGLGVAFGINYWAMGRRTIVVLQGNPASQNLSSQILADRAVLKNSASGAEMIFGALARLGEARDEVGFAEALRRAASPAPREREGVARALPHYREEEAFKVFDKMLNDPSSTVRLAAIEGLPLLPSERRMVFLSKLEARRDLGAMERIYLDGVWLQEINFEGRSPAAKRLIGALNSEVGDQVGVAANRLLLFGGNDPAVLEALRATVVAPRIQPGVAADIVTALAGRKDPWILENFRALAFHPQKAVRAALIGSIHYVNPPQKWSILRTLYRKDPDLEVRAKVIGAAKLLGGGEADLLAP